MTVFQALILGVVQGVGEFLPISSSAHLVLVPWLFGWQYAGLTFDVALHTGTLISVAAFFWRDWLDLAKEAFYWKSKTKGRLFWLIIIATLPGVTAGFILEEKAETVFRTPALIGIMLVIMGIILYLADIKMPSKKGLYDITLVDGLLIGLSQAFAIIPGVSRSGVTMTAGRLLKVERESSARFSFLLSTPIIVGAAVLKLGKISPADINAAFLTGVISSAVVGFLSIGFLLKYLTKHSFGIFAWYRFLIGGAVIILSFFK